MAHKLFRAIEQPDLIDDPRFLDNASRLHNVEALDAILSAFIEKRSQADILDLFNAAGVSVGPIMNAQSLSTDPYMIERESLIEVPDSDMGWVPMHGAVPRFSATPGIFARPAPALGEHSREILAPLLGAERFAALLADRVIFASG
jgi:crotonobetainyl-CoA:carnitine CoA-transferase CaiB-like acyl-CoA transferase